MKVPLKNNVIYCTDILDSELHFYSTYLFIFFLLGNFDLHFVKGNAYQFRKTDNILKSILTLQK